MEKFLITEEGASIKADVELLKSMGFDKQMINKVYIILRPENIERAVDYMTEIDGIYQHDFISSNNSNGQTVCFICKKPKQNHLDYIPDDLLIEAHNNDLNNNAHNVNIEQNDFIQENNNNNNNNFVDDYNINECEVCYEEINEKDKEINSMKCGHLFCTHCWFNYLKTAITEAKVEQIKCMDHECKEILSEEFILNHISENQNLIEKYNKFKKRAEIIKDKNKKICPKPDCDSFLKKSNKSKYVECENGHKYCFDCLNPPHGTKQCDQNLENQFLKWKKGKRVKRCPRCQMYTEKNEGCNHMTCVSCKYQWCWLCEGEYKYDHYRSGRCDGQQFTKADSLNEIEKLKNAFGLHKIFPCVYKPINGPFIVESNLCLRYTEMLVFFLFGVFVNFSLVVFHYCDDYVFVDNDCLEITFFVFIFLIAFCLMIPFQIIFTCTVAPFMLIALFYNKFFERLLIFYGIGDNYSF